MTYNQLFEQFKNRYGDNHDVIFFELVYYCSVVVKDKNDFITNRNVPINFKERKFWKLANQYFVKQKPLAHITGHTKFCGLDFAIHKKVLAPREVTEQMTQDFINTHKQTPAAPLWDLCCGSGCIGISIKKYLPQFEVVCIDKYWGPIFNTHDNGVKHKTPLTVDCKDAVNFLNSQSFAGYIISNPPYINFSNFKNNKMFKYESKNALIAEENGMYFYKKYFEWLSKHTFKEAWFEIGYDLVEPIKLEISKYKDLTLEMPKDRQYIIIKRKR